MKQTKLITAVLLTAVATVCMAQDRTTQFGKFIFSSSIGLMPTYVIAGGQTHVPPVGLTAGLRVNERFTVHLYSGFTDVTSAPRYFYDGYYTVVNNKTWMIGLRSQLHKEITERVDVYGGMTFGMAHSKRTEKDPATGKVMKRTLGQPSPYDPNAPNSTFLYAAFVGATYHFDNKVGVFAEAGYGISLLNFGIVTKL